MTVYCFQSILQGEHVPYSAAANKWIFVTGWEEKNILPLMKNSKYYPLQKFALEEVRSQYTIWILNIQI